MSSVCVCVDSRQTTHKDRAEKEICTNRISIPDETLRYSSVVVGVTHEMECEGAKKIIIRQGHVVMSVLYCTQGWMNLLNGVPLHLAFMSGLCVDVLHLQQPPAFLLLLLASSCATHILLTLTAGWMVV